MSAGWGRFQGEGTGPDWLAPEDDDEAEAPSGWAQSAGAASADGAPSGWAAWAVPTESRGSAAAPGPAAPAPAAPADDEPPAWLDEPEEESSAPSGWAPAQTPHRSFAKPERQAKTPGARKPAGRSGFGEGGRSGFGEGGRGGSRGSGGGKGTAKSGAAGDQSPAKPGSAKPAWQSRRKDRDPDAEPAEKKPQSREKLEQRAKNILLYHLARQMQTRSQLADRLRKKEIPDDIAQAVLDRFEELHLLDDATYAETFVRSRHSERGLAKRALGYELRKRGVDNDTAEEALATLDEDQEAETARRLVEGRLRSTRNLDQQVRVRRLVGMLARKGYSSAVAMRAVKEALAEEGERLDAGLDPGIADALDDAALE